MKKPKRTWTRLVIDAASFANTPLRQSTDYRSPLELIRFLPLFQRLLYRM